MAIGRQPGYVPRIRLIRAKHKRSLLCHLGNITYRNGRGLACDPKNGHVMVLWSREYEKGPEPRV
jgi:hypothetical protein